MGGLPICTCPWLCIILTEFICDKLNIILSNLLECMNFSESELINCGRFFFGNKHILDAVGTLLWFCVASYRIASGQILYQLDAVTNYLKSQFLSYSIEFVIGFVIKIVFCLHFNQIFFITRIFVCKQACSIMMILPQSSGKFNVNFLLFCSDLKE